MWGRSIAVVAALNSIIAWSAPLLADEQFELPSPELSLETPTLRQVLAEHGASFGETRDCGKVGGKTFLCQPITRPEVTDSQGKRMAVVGPPYPAPLPLLGEFDYLYPTKNLDYAPAPWLQAGSYSWVPLDEVMGGTGLFDDLQRRAARNEVVGCNMGACTILAFASSTKPATGDGIAACSVRRMKEGFSSPMGCEYLVYVPSDSPNKVFVRALDGFSDSVVASAGRTDFSIEVQEAQIAVDKLLDAIANALKASPFSAQVQLSTDELVATANYKYFKPIDLFVLYTIIVRRSGRSSDSTLVNVATTLYVSPRTSDASGDWRMPSDVINSAFLEALRELVSRQLQRSCKSVRVQVTGYGFGDVFTCTE